jgi:hypothetical protein
MYGNGLRSFYMVNKNIKPRDIDVYIDRYFVFLSCNIMISDNVFAFNLFEIKYKQTL